MIINKYEILQSFWSIALTTPDTVRICNREQKDNFL